MQLNVTLVTSEYRGDHAADVRLAYNVDPSMSVHDLANKLLHSGPDNTLTPSAYVEIRIAVPLS